MATSDASILVRDLLRLRRWAVDVLASQPKSHDLSDIGHEVWLLFLVLERCAGVLLDRLAMIGTVASLPPDGASLLRSVASEEAQSVLRARVDARDLAAIAQKAGYPIAVLKGGVRVLSGASPGVPVVDIDVLVKRENVTDLVKTLTAAGFGTALRKLDHHQGITPASDRLAVEVHWTTHDDGTPIDPGIWERLRPIDTARPLMQLGAIDHLLHLLDHAVLIHRERSVSLRDTILIGIAARDCTDAELDAVRRSIAHHGAMTTLLDFAIAIESRAAGIDPFEDSCATYYSAMILAGRVEVLKKSVGARAFVTEVELARISRSQSALNTLRWRGTGNELLSRLADRIPGLGRIILAPAHLAFYTLVAAMTLPEIRRTKEKALRALAQRTSL